MPNTDFTSIRLGDFVAKTTFRGGGVIRKTKHKVINFAADFFVLDSNEKITYQGKRHPAIRGTVEGQIMYSHWLEDDRELFQSDVINAASELVGPVVAALQQKFPECSEEFISEMLCNVLTNF